MFSEETTLIILERDRQDDKRNAQERPYTY